MLFGRDRERTRIGALLEAARASRSGALVIGGEPGIGKTALLEDAKERATDMEVLSARGVQSESELPFAALHQLLRPLLADIPLIPSRQASALQGALGIGESVHEERFLVFAACLSLLSEVAERLPVLCLVDDAHWLDAASADALLFVCRRLDAEGIVILFAAREGDANTFEAPGIPHLRLGGLEDEAAESLLGRDAGVEAAPQVRHELVTQTVGNPLALLEIPSGLTPAQLSGDQPLPPALPLTRQLEDVFLQRVRSLAPDAQRLLLIAAADDSESAATVARATGSGDRGLTALDLAETAELISVEAGRLKFRHPLVRSAVYSAATSTERRDAHRALADALDGDHEQRDRRVWHLASAALEPDETVASALVDTAERAQSRAGFAAAASALERAAELSPDSTDRAHRLVEAARCASVAGADVKALALVDRARLLIDDPVQRAELTSVVGVAEIRRGNPNSVCRPLLNAAREIVASQPDRALELLLDAAWAATEVGDPAMLEIYRFAAGLADSALGERAAFTVSLLSGLGAVAERDAENAIIELGKVVAAGSEDDDPYHVLWAGSAAFSMGDEERAGALWARGAELARARGALGLLAPALGFLSLRNLIAQRLDQAALTATEAEQLARAAGAENLMALPWFVLGTVAAIPGARRRGKTASKRRDRTRQRSWAAARSCTSRMGAGPCRPWPRALGGRARSARVGLGRAHRAGRRDRDADDPGPDRGGGPSGTTGGCATGPGGLRGLGGTHRHALGVASSG